jgi:hypothetical protein
MSDLRVEMLTPADRVNTNSFLRSGYQGEEDGIVNQIGQRCS